MDLYGTVTDIQRFCLHDGPGIRTSVFFKGCNIDCAWCHNPETISMEPEVIVDPEKCIGCGMCAEECFSGARRGAGRRYSVEELIGEILQDREYYGASGGVTLTGGEPACQVDFACAVLEACRKEGIGRAIETNLCYEKSVLARLAKLCDVVMCDLKIWDEDAHKKWVGISNRQVKENIKYLSSLGVSFAVRTTVVLGINDTENEIENIAGFLSDLPNLMFYELLSYNPLGLSKRIEGKAARLAFECPAKEIMLALANQARKKVSFVRMDGVEIEINNGGNRLVTG